MFDFTIECYHAVNRLGPTLLLLPGMLLSFIGRAQEEDFASRDLLSPPAHSESMFGNEGKVRY